MKVVILGGGPSGLGAAWGLVDRGFRDITILEKNPGLGGLSGSFPLWGGTLDYGPHRFSPEYPDLVKRIEGLLGSDWLKFSNEHAFALQDRIYHYPPLFTDFLNQASVRLGTAAALSLGWERTVRAALRGMFGKPGTATFQQELERRFGRVLYQRVLGPLSEKVWGDPLNIDPEFAALRFALPPLSRWAAQALGISKSFNDGSFYYPRRGFQQLWDALGAHLTAHGVRILPNVRMTSISLNGRQATGVTFSRDGKIDSLPCDYLVSTIPSQHFIRFLNPNPLSPAQVMATQFSTRGMLLACFLVNKERTLPARVVIFPEKKFLFNRLSEQNQFSRDTVPAGFSVVQADVLTEIESRLWATKDSELIASLLDQLVTAKLVKLEDVVQTKLIRVPFAYPLPTHSREREQRDLNELMVEYNNILCTGRFSSSDYNNSHTALKKGLSAAEVVAQEKTLAQWIPEAERIRKTAIRD